MTPTNTHTYDNLDRELISLLRKDGRASLTHLAEKLKVSRGTVQNRLDRLQASGVLLGFTVRIREDQGLDTIRAIMMIEVVGKSASQVIRELRGFPELVALHSTNGAWDLVAEIQTSSLAEFDRVLGSVRIIDGVLNSETSILLTTV
ncbi:MULTISPECIES: Lrp/AsnC family transcriptional regulator [unclassified Cocleimonas]|uniref:Lrp/AsnC family transcriptional regulator n=1 Tax=unclassified Cocleimonas TaxID=2639732 RepID=UPI0026110C5D|nr:MULTISPECIES: Lrp/AsnC family transcriptional regulator [unclassified Cocleimonas]MEB8431185.1 Lrp/AsnC family transcriptional regulator [Cocleimonas sp. KMM 6892]MEC4714043.1 Lrp/AsnC family transcriptional regulator [Cocleimonas sp. KMM 6895]MEC4743374.1 Lrp/AsnC family transcriptional regulator [Cocleimonas sp. KMM 6896]